MIRTGKAPIVGGGENRRSMVYTENLVQGMILAATKEIASGKTYWIADERPYTMNEIIDTIELLLKNDFSLECNYGRMKLPGFVSVIAEKIDTLLQSMGLYHQKMHVLSEMNKHIACTIDLAKKELGYLPEYSLEIGMHTSLSEMYN
jgi:nucleoside-diphosphate-sugar epimerase